MRFLIQTVTSAHVEIIEKKIKKSIGNGLLIYVGISHTDILSFQSHITRFSEKIASLKIFIDDQGKINKTLHDINGEILLIPNFTLYGQNKKGRQIDFAQAANFADANSIFLQLIASIQKQNINLQTGEFGANMLVSAINNGPINVIMDY